MNKIELLDIIKASGLVPVFYHPDPEMAKDVVHACYEGGCRVFEFTNRGSNAPETFSVLDEYRKKHLPGLVLGAGTIMDIPSFRLFKAAGADFTVSPVLNEELVEASGTEFLHIPGCGSVSEIDRAERLGASLVKLFPAEVLGPRFIKALLGPMPGRKIMPSGGVFPEKENLQSWFDSGAFCVGMGSPLFVKNLIENKDMSGLRETVASILNMINQIRNA